MALNNLRNYYQEQRDRLITEWSLYQKHDRDPEVNLDSINDADLRRLYDSHRHKFEEDELYRIYQSEFTSILEEFKNKNSQRNEPFQYYSIERFNDYPPNRIPAPGIHPIPLIYHKGQTVTATEQVPESGFQLHPLIDYLITNKYPRYRAYTDKYCRPLGTTDATFNDFNRPQQPSKPIDQLRKTHILAHLHKRLATSPFLPLHYVDTQHAKLPLHTGTGYHNRFSYTINAHARYSHPEEYKTKHTSKGYYTNAFHEGARTLIHHIKQLGIPFDPSNLLHETSAQRLNRFINEYPTMLFTRNHISDRDGNLKQRPVYAVDELFLTVETMLTFPLLVMARKHDCCIMYGLETIRGSNHYLDHIARSYKSFFTIDWSQYDQRLPRVITDIYYTDFLESLIAISHGYQPTYEFQTYPDLTEEMMFKRTSNLLWFLHTWYNNMTYLSSDGYAYRRTCAGVPSGLYNTQYIDSFGNLFLIIDGFIEYGYSDQEIDRILLFIMGDDNSGFTHLSIGELESFLFWFEDYTLHRYNMILSKSKSIITIFRNRIETLSYQCNFGMPIRPLDKLVAQLCYPEHGPVDKYMSARAIGIAYAAAGMNFTFHCFCEDIYNTFAPYAATPDTETFFNILKFLPGQFKMLDSYFEEINLTYFPSIHEVRNKYAEWQGPLDYSPKWNFAHFVNAPNIVPPSVKTMADYRIEHNIQRDPIPILETVGLVYSPTKA